MDFKKIDDSSYEKVALALKVDSNYDADYIKQLMVASRISVANRVGTDNSFYDDEENEAIFEMAVLCMVHDRYYYPGSISDDEIFDISASLDSYVMDLKARYLVFENNKEKVMENGNS